MKYKYLLFTVAMLVVTYGSYSQPVLVFNIKITTENHETEGIEMILINKHGDNNRQAVNAESTLILDANNYYNITFTQPHSRSKKIEIDTSLPANTDMDTIRTNLNLFLDVRESVEKESLKKKECATSAIYYYHPDYNRFVVSLKGSRY
ncbi:MAG: hypothetical protein JSS90_06660 [Bacteroidetes bacterium]|jgi:hypothetical protein|nr:hypothetical protein [Bacteroidota bacterium]